MEVYIKRLCVSRTGDGNYILIKDLSESTDDMSLCFRPGESA